MASPATAADIVETAVTNGNFKTLAAALQAAGLVDTLKGQGPYTVFAPTDDAFKKLPAGTVENLLKPENKAQLQKILTYHVVAGNVKSGDLKGKTTSAQTVEGTAVQIDASGNSVKVNDATVTQADISTSNGVIHVIDSVIMPKS
ncbi:fasciclin domain-containing protein [Microvirga calopogonii]|uniref:fasciclin domain-containing protein n=1 Tax=Microvirga calopogonii TaxID=2078013 RepID=UPI001FE23FC7|nr:fasciclin domain-containing protein [Microvirga calopogonii]